MARHRIFAATFASIYPLYVRKVERKGHTQAEVDQVIGWLTGYDAAGLQRAIADEVDLETFFARAPAFTPDAALITGSICGHRVERIEDPVMQRIRYLDLLVDEVARGKKMTSILRRPPARPPGRPTDRPIRRRVLDADPTTKRTAIRPLTGDPDG